MSTLKVNAIRNVLATSDSVTLATDGTCTAKITNNLSNRNKIINGSMICSQRGSSFTADGYTLDRFKRSGSSDGAFTVSQSTTSPDGFANSLKVDVTTADTSLAAGQFAQLTHKIEAQNLQDLAYGTSSAKSIVVSFYVRSNKTGTYSFNILQNDNSSKQVTLNYTINSADTWERKTFSIAGDTSGVINNDNGSGFQMTWGLAYGSTYTSGSARPAWTAYANADFGAGQAVNLLDSTSNEWYLTGVQLEVDHTGSGVATDFEHISFDQELDRCHRYYQRWEFDADKIGVAVLHVSSNTTSYSTWKYYKPLRSSGSDTSFSYSGASDFDMILDGNYDRAITSMTNSTTRRGKYQSELVVQWSSAGSNDNSASLRSNGSSGWIAFSAEL